MSDARRDGDIGASDRPGRSAWTWEGRLPLALAAVFGLTFLILAVAVEEQPVLQIDTTTRALVQWEHSSVLDFLMHALSRIGSGYVLIPLALISGLVLWRQSRALGGFMPAVTAGAVLAEWLAKWIVARPRPHHGPHAFPSGHVLTSVVIFGALIYVLWRLVNRPLWRWSGTAGGVLLVFGIAYSRLYLDAHWVTDVLGSLAGGTAFLLLALYCLDRYLRVRRAARPTAHPSF